MVRKISGGSTKILEKDLTRKLDFKNRNWYTTYQLQRYIEIKNAWNIIQT